MSTNGILSDWLAERVGFEALNVEPCTGLHDSAPKQETKHLAALQFPPVLIGVF
jgi:hypothetical protein